MDPEVAEVAGGLVPMPGGVGPMTRAMLLTNVGGARRARLTAPWSPSTGGGDVRPIPAMAAAPGLIGARMTDTVRKTDGIREWDDHG